MPLWINLSGLPLDDWNARALGRIISVLGKPIVTDKFTSSKGRVSYMRLLVEIDAVEGLVRTVEIKLPTGKLESKRFTMKVSQSFGLLANASVTKRQGAISR